MTNNIIINQALDALKASLPGGMLCQQQPSKEIVPMKMMSLLRL